MPANGASHPKYPGASSAERETTGNFKPLSTVSIISRAAMPSSATALYLVPGSAFELCKMSPEFEALWRDNDVHAYGGGAKHLQHPVLGPITMEYSAFAVDGRPDLSMVVYNPMESSDAERIRSLIASQPSPAEA